MRVAPWKMPWKMPWKIIVPGIVLAAACVTPSRVGEPAASLELAGAVAPDVPSVGLIRDIDRLAARVDELGRERSRPVAFEGDALASRRRGSWITALAAVEQRVRRLRESHPDLEPACEARLQRLVIEPLRSLRAEAR